jgi:DNA topoisomerase IB
MRMGKTATLTRSDLGGAGIRRRRRDRGFSYTGPDGALLRDPRTLARGGDWYAAVATFRPA